MEEECFLLGPAERCGAYSVDSSVRESVKRGLMPEAAEYPLLELLLGNDK
jgi:hypothetical protein